MNFWGLIIVVYLIGMLITRSKRPGLPIWSIMAFAMFMVIIVDLVDVDELTSLINIDVVLFLIGMFSIVSILDYSGVIDYLALWFTTRFKTRRRVLYALALTYGLLSAYTVNDALTLMGTPLAITLARAIGVEVKIVLILIAFSITIGSVPTPMGNPQNMLVSSASGITAPFLSFTRKLLIPTVINLLLTTYIILKLYRVGEKKLYIPLIPSEAIRDRREALLGVILFAVTISLFILNDVLESLGLPHIGKRGLIPFVVSALAYVLSKNPRKIIEGISWGTIIFFISMFITMNGIWRSGVLQPLLVRLLPGKTSGLVEYFGIAASAIFLSQVLSNVPFTNLYIEYLKHLGYTGMDVNAWITLAMSATIAGNLTILGAASNIILLEVVEQKGGEPLSFTEFLKIGSIVTTLNLLVYTPFILLIN